MTKYRNNIAYHLRADRLSKAEASGLAREIRLNEKLAFISSKPINGGRSKVYQVWSTER